MERTMEFILHGLFGAVFGGLLVFGAAWSGWDVEWWIVAAGAGVGFVVFGAFGDRAWEWAGELTWWGWWR